MTVANAIDSVIQAVLLGGILASLWFYLTSYYGAWNLLGRQRRAQKTRGNAPLPTVTILKPLRGLEPELYENLASFCRQTYPVFQVVFGVRDEKDPVIETVGRLRANFPHVRIDLVVDGDVYGANYKVSNLYHMYAAALHDVIVIADSDVRVPQDYLHRIVASLDDPRVGVVSCLYRAVRARGLPARLESLFINTDFAPMVLVASVVEKPTYAFGATMALRRDALDAIGGFLPLADVLADDYNVGQRLVGRGYGSVLSDLVVDTVLGKQSWRQVLDHQLRWARTYRSCRPRGYFFSIITHGTLWTTLNAAYHGFGAAACMLAVSVWLLRGLVARRIAHRYLGVPLSWSDTILVPVKDLFVSAIWMLSYASRTVQWGDERFRVLADGRIVPLSSPYESQVASLKLQAAQSHRRKTAGTKLATPRL